MNRYFSLIVTLSIFYLFSQQNFVHSSSAGSWGNSASKLNLGVWIPPMTLRLPKFNMPKIKISATIKPRKNQPPMKIHLPEMSLNAKALGDDDNYGGSGGGGSYGGSGGGGGSYGGSGGGGSYGGNEGYSGGNSYSSGGDSYSSGGASYSSGGGGAVDGYGSGGSAYNDYGAAGGGGSSGYGSSGYRASASNQNNQKQNGAYQSQSNNEQQYQTVPQQSNNYGSNNQNTYNDYNRYQPPQQDQRNAYYHVDNQQPARYQTESVSYGASNSVQSGYSPARQQGTIERSYRSTSGAVVQPLSNYVKREKGSSSGNSAYGYAVNSNYRYARN